VESTRDPKNPRGAEESACWACLPLLAGLPILLRSWTEAGWRTDAVHVGKDLHANCSHMAVISRHSEYSTGPSLVSPRYRVLPLRIVLTMLLRHVTSSFPGTSTFLLHETTFRKDRTSRMILRWRKWSTRLSVPGVQRHFVD
jgi:hypothetical protein